MGKHSLCLTAIAMVTWIFLPYHHSFISIPPSPLFLLFHIRSRFPSRLSISTQNLTPWCMGFDHMLTELDQGVNFRGRTPPFPLRPTLLSNDICAIGINESKPRVMNWDAPQVGSRRQFAFTPIQSRGNHTREVIQTGTEWDIAQPTSVTWYDWWKPLIKTSGWVGFQAACVLCGATEQFRVSVVPDAHSWSSADSLPAA